MYLDYFLSRATTSGFSPCAVLPQADFLQLFPQTQTSLTEASPTCPSVSEFEASAAGVTGQVVVDLHYATSWIKGLWNSRAAVLVVLAVHPLIPRKAHEPVMITGERSHLGWYVGDFWLTWLMPLDSLWNKGPQQHPSSELDSGWSSLARTMLFRRPLSQHRCFSPKSASGDWPYTSLADSSQGRSGLIATWDRSQLPMPQKHSWRTLCFSKAFSSDTLNWNAQPFLRHVTTE